MNLQSAPVSLNRAMRLVLSVGLTLGFVFAGSRCAAADLSPALPPIVRTAAQIRQMSAETAARQIPVSLSGVVTYYDRGWGLLFVQDKTAGIFIFADHSTIKGDLRTGERVKVTGVTTPADFVPSIANAQITVEGPGSLPIPVHPDPETLLSGRLDSQWAELGGIVRFVEVRRNHVYVSVDGNGRPFHLTLQSAPGDWARRLPDSEISVSGVVSMMFNNRRQVIGVNMDVPDAQFVRVVRPAPDPDGIPFSRISTLGQFAAEANNHRVRLKGTVEGREGLDTVYVANGQDTVAVRGTCNVAVGDLVEVVGFAEFRDYHRLLEDSLCRKVGHGSLRSPHAVVAADILQNNSADQSADTRNDLAVLSLDADVLQATSGKPVSLLLQSGNLVFEALFGSADVTAPSHIEPGSRVRVSGLCVIRYDQFQRAEGFRFIMRTPADLVVVSRPSWWNSKHTFWVLTFTALGAGLILIWVITLRRRVEQQTQTITGKLEHEAKLERRYQRLFECNLAAVISLDGNGKILDCNPALAKLLGRTDCSLLIGTPFSRYVVSRSSFDGFLQSVLNTGNAPHCELALQRQDGTAADVVMSGILSESETQERLVQATIVDITAQKQFEAELIRSKEAAEVGSQLKSEFLANMSHEIRTPLNGMMGMTSLALAADVNAEVREYLQMAQDSATHLLSLLNDVLDYSKIEAGRINLEQVRFEPRDVLRRATRTLAVKAHEKGLEILYSVDDSVPKYVLGDPHRLQQILLNLMGNAVKFTESGHVLVHAQAMQMDGKVDLRVQVEDSGVGIPVDKQARIFEPFTQADDSTARKFGGTGLGLSISAQLAGLMGGGISLCSNPGEGSTFSFNCIFDGIPGQQLPPMPTALSFLRTRRAVVCVKNSALESELMRLLKNWGMAVSAARWSQLSSESFLRSPDTPVVICDCRHGEQEVGALFETWKSGQGRARPLVLLDAVDMRGLIDRCDLLGVPHLLKPFDEDELRSTLAGMLSEQARPQTVPVSAGANAVAHAMEPAGKRLLVLVAEDNAVNQKLAGALLRRAGHEVDIVANGMEAVAANEAKNYDVILMDVQMPEMDGFEATARIRNGGGPGRSVPIIALTAHALEGYREKCIRSGMNEFLTKPIEPAKLMTVLNTIADGALTAQ